jgi:glutathione S-transferase
MARSMFEKNEEQKKILQDKLANESLPHNLKIFNERLGKTGSGFIAASGLSWADLYLFGLLDNLGDKREAVLANFKNVKALDDKLRAHPNISAWLAKRPKTEF